MNDQAKEVEGTLLRGPDGGIYFIPNDALASFRIPEEHAGEARKWLAEQQEVQGFMGKAAERSIIIAVGVTATLLGVGPLAMPLLRR